MPVQYCDLRADEYDELTGSEYDPMAACPQEAAATEYCNLTAEQYDEMTAEQYDQLTACISQTAGGTFRGPPARLNLAPLSNPAWAAARKRRKGRETIVSNLYKTSEYAPGQIGIPTGTVFPDRTVPFTFALRVLRTAVGSNGILFEFGGNTDFGIAAWINGDTLGFAAGANAGDNGVSVEIPGAFPVVGQIFDVVLGVLPGLGQIRGWVEGARILEGQSVNQSFNGPFAGTEDGAIGSVAVTVTDRVPVAQRVTLTNAQVAGDVFVYKGQRPRDWNLGPLPVFLTYAETLEAIGNIQANWPMNETSGVVVDNAHGNVTFDQDIVGGPTLGEPGAVAGSTSFEFDQVADSAFSINNLGILPVALPISFSYWIKRPIGGWVTVDNYYGCFSSRATSNRYMLMYCSPSDQTPRFGIRDGAVFVEVVGPVISDNDWHHVALYARPGFINMAVDGVFVGEVAHAVSTDFSLWENVAIGGFIQSTQTTTVLTFKGNIDQVSVHALQFSQQNVDDLFAHKV